MGGLVGTDGLQSLIDGCVGLQLFFRCALGVRLQTLGLVDRFGEALDQRREFAAFHVSHVRLDAAGSPQRCEYVATGYDETTLPTRDV